MENLKKMRNFKGTNEIKIKNGGKSSTNNSLLNSKHSPLTTHISGITLIALVVTIVILLILAAITINLVLAEGGLFDRAKEAAVAQRLAEYKDKIEITRATVAATGTNYGNVPIKDLVNELGKQEIIAEDLDNDGVYEIVVEGIDETIKITSINNGKNVNIEYPKTSGTTGDSSEVGSGSISMDVENEHLRYLYNNIVSMMNNDNTIDLLLNDQKLLEIVLSVNENVDYIVNNKDIFLDKVLNSKIAVKTLAKNTYAKSQIQQNSEWISALEKCDYAYEEWTQPVMTGYTKTVDEGTINITVSGVSATYLDGYRAMDGKSGNGEGGYWWYNVAPAYWQVEFPYKIRIKKIDFYNQYSTLATNTILTARLYTDSTRTISIGNQFSFSANTSWQKVTISGIEENQILTNTIYFYKTNGAAGIGEIVISAEKFIF